MSIVVERTGQQQNFRSPTYGQPTRSPGKNNRVSFSRKKPKEPSRPSRPSKKPEPVQQKRLRNRAPIRGRRQIKPPQGGGLSPMNEMLMERERQRRAQESQRWEQQRRDRRFREGFTTPSGSRLTRKKSRKLAQKGIEKGAKKLGKRVIRIINPVGKLQDAWDLGTGIGGLGRGIIGIDETNPYENLPGFGIAELSWELGNAIEDLINPDNDLDDAITPSNQSSESEASVTTNPIEEIISKRNDISDPSDEPIIIRPSLPPINPKYFDSSFIVTVEFTYTIERRNWDKYDGQYYYASYAEFVYKDKYEIRVKGVDPDVSPIGAASDDTHYSYEQVSKTEQYFGDFIFGSGYDNVVAYRAKISNSSIRYNVNGEVNFENYNTNYGFPYQNQAMVKQSSFVAKSRFDDFQFLVKSASNLIPLEHSPDNPNNRKRFNGRNYLPIYLNKQLITNNWDALRSNDGSYYAGFEAKKVTDFKYGISDLNGNPIIRQPIRINKLKMSECKANDLMAELDKRLSAVEAALETANIKLGENTITELTITTTDENGQESEEIIALDGIGGTTAKILENQYIQDNQTGLEEINKKLGSQIIEPDTELPWGETLTAAGIGGGGLIGLALLSQKKFGPQVQTLSTFNNIGGNGANIIPELTQSPTGGIGGGITKINDDLQTDKHENAKRDKLNLRGSLIDLLNLALNLHNAFSLSSALLDTIVSFLSNVFQIFGFNDKDGNPIDIKDVVGDTIENILKKLIGTEATEELFLFLTKANRIIQTGSNVLFDLQGLTDTVRSISQQTGEYVAKIGNALRRNRIVPDDPEESYQWMDEDMRPTSAFHKRIESISEELSNVTDFIGSLESVTSEVLSAQEQFTSLKSNINEFKQLVTEEETKKEETEAENTTVSQSTEVNLDSVKN